VRAKFILRIYIVDYQYIIKFINLHILIEKICINPS
jgi:hypothetical protein